MKRYTLVITAEVTVEAESIEEAKEKLGMKLLSCDIKNMEEKCCTEEK